MVFLICTCCQQFVSVPSTAHYAALLRFLRYIRGNNTRLLFFSATSSSDLRVYSDADWTVMLLIGDPLLGSVFFLEIKEAKCGFQI